MLLVVFLVLLLFTILCIYLFAVSHVALVFCLPGVVLSCCGFC